MKVLITSCIAAVLLGLTAGCVKYTKPVAPRVEMAPAEKNFQALWRASQAVLRKYYFELDWQDRRAAVITTKPMTGKHWFEFWRHDSVSKSDVSESTIQTIYRIVEVRLVASDFDPEKYVPLVKVLAFRSDQETPKVTSTSDAYSLFKLPGGYDVPMESFLLAQEEEQTADTERPSSTLPKWYVPVGTDGRDLRLERELTAEIKVAAARLAAR